MTQEPLLARPVFEVKRLPEIGNADTGIVNRDWPSVMKEDPDFLFDVLKRTVGNKMQESKDTKETHEQQLTDLTEQLRAYKAGVDSYLSNKRLENCPYGTNNHYAITSTSPSVPFKMGCGRTSCPQWLDR